MKKIVLCIIGASLLLSDCFAQKQNPTSGNWVKSIFSKKTAQDNRDSLSMVLAQKDNLLEAAAEQAKADSARISLLTDSLSRVTSLLEEKTKEYDALLEDLDFADRSMMTLAYRRCGERFDKAKVDKALSYFDRLHKPETKEEWAGLKIALKDYERCNNEIRGILERAQKDSGRTMKSMTDSFREKYIFEIKRSEYYYKYRAEKPEFRIEYLDGIIDKALDMLEGHTGAEPADFHELLKLL